MPNPLFKKVTTLRGIIIVAALLLLSAFIFGPDKAAEWVEWIAQQAMEGSGQ